jgi:inhibitor of the pro-sigma K processing machinery
MKIVLKIIYNAVIGGIVLIVINLVGKLFGFCMALNAVSALIVGILGIPGIALLIVLKFILL